MEVVNPRPLYDHDPSHHPFESFAAPVFLKFNPGPETSFCSKHCLLDRVAPFFFLLGDEVPILCRLVPWSVEQKWTYKTSFGGSCSVFGF